jgi:hypothetical protein
VWTLWTGRIGTRWLLVFVGFSLWPGGSERSRTECDQVFEARAWDRVVKACSGPRWGGRASLAQGWIAWAQGRDGEALALAEQLLESDVAADAAYLAGYLQGQRENATQEARAYIHRALQGFQRAGRHADASRAAGLLSRLPRPEQRFSDELRMAQLAVSEAEQSNDISVLGRASAALAEAYDYIGMAQAAHESFLRAEQLTEPWPAELAHVYFKHAGFLLDLGDPENLDTSLHYLDAALAAHDRAIAAGLGRQVAELPLAIRLNRADALSQLGQLDAADRELAAARRDLGERAAVQLQRIRLVEGYVAARRDQPAAAEALFVEAAEGSLDSDYRWRIALEQARSYRSTGHRDRAEQTYHKAIAIIEQVRSSAAIVELRPWVLARRTPPYVELLQLLVEQNRGVDALVIAESLHARAWLDVVLGNAVSRPTTTEVALTAARLRQRLGTASVPPLDGASLMRMIGDREALVFLAIGSTTWRAHIAHGSVEFTRLPANTQELARKFSADPDDHAACARASEILLPEDLSERSDTLYIIATGPLSDVPFAALHWQDRYLIEQRSVARLPGLAALRSISAHWDQRAILVGDSRGDLPEAAREVRELAAAMNISASVGSAASREVLTSARGARMLHVAVHGIATSSGRAMVLADGNLTAADVLDAELDPQIVVLSGCATAASEDAESWDGFPSAFLAAGSRYVVATLRSLEDAAAARVTEAYYAQLDSMNPIERLAAAQRKVIGTLPVAHWASFAAWGSSTCDDDALQCSISLPPSSFEQQGLVRPSVVVPSRAARALTGGPRAVRRRSWRTRRNGSRS